MKPGNYKARPIDVGIKAHKDKIFVRVLMEVQFPNAPKVLGWRGWLTTKAIPYTLKQLFAIGMNGKNLKMLMSGAEGKKCINTMQLVDVSVAGQQDENGNPVCDNNGDQYFEIYYIGQVQMQSDKDALGKLNQQSLLSEMMKIEEKNRAQPQYQTSNQTEMTDIPF